MQVKIQIHQQIQVNALTHVLTQFSEKVDFEPNIVVKYAIKKQLFINVWDHPTLGKAFVTVSE